MPHALLFHGPEGCGKDAFALGIARLVNCSAAENPPCGKCPDCQKIMALQHPGLKWIFPTPAASAFKPADLLEALKIRAGNPFLTADFKGKNLFIGIDTVRELKKEAQFKMYEGKKKVFIISQAERMRPEAANALLKLLEEPPANLMIILTTANLYAVLPTIQSRCQLLRFRPYSLPEIETIINRYEPESDPAVRHAAIRLAGGNIRRAFEFMETDILAQRELAVDFLRKALQKGRPRELLSVIEKVTAKKDRREAKNLIWMLILWFQDILHLKNFPDNSELLHNSDKIDNLARFRKFAPDADIQAVVWELENALKDLDDVRNLNPVLILTPLAIKLRSVIKKAS